MTKLRNDFEAKCLKLGSERKMTSFGDKFSEKVKLTLLMMRICYEDD